MTSPVPADRWPRRLDDLADDQLERFARHLSLDGFGPQAQLALLRSRVLVVGAGGLGSPVLTYLAAAGVGEIHVVDDDAVDRSNLHRQVIHAETDVGRPKTASAAETMRGLHPQVRVVEHRRRLTADNALELVGGVDLVVDGADNYDTRYLVADACEIAGVPVVWGAILRFAGQVALFHPGEALYRDVFPEPPEPGEVPSCAAAGVLGVLPGIVGSLMAAEAVKHLSGVGRTLRGRLLSVDALSMRMTQMSLSPDPGRAPVRDLDEHRESAPCGRVAHGAGAEAGEAAREAAQIDAARLAALLADPQRRRGLRLLDVREGWERRLERIEAPAGVTDLHVPMPTLLEGLDAASGQAGGEHRPPAGACTVVYCEAGSRSSRAARALAEAAGPQAEVLSLVGGLAAWRDRPTPAG